MSGLERFVELDQPQPFIGQEALVRLRDRGIDLARGDRHRRWPMTDRP
ncbi:MAG: hypothetical protein U0V56_05320 [Actinomycetota bacterium]